MAAIIHSLAIFLYEYRYFIIFLAAFFEGPAVMLIGGFLFEQGVFTLFPLFLCLFLGDLLADFFWYWAGRLSNQSLIYKYGHFFNITPEIIQKAEARFKTYRYLILWISKFTLGFGFSLVTLFTAGVLKIKFGRYIWINFVGGLIWVSAMILIGYLFGSIYGVIADPFKWLFLGVDIILLVAFLAIVNRFLATTKISS